MDQTRDVARAYKFTQDTQPWKDLTCRQPQYNTCPALFFIFYSGYQVVHYTFQSSPPQFQQWRLPRSQSQIAGGGMLALSKDLLHLGTASRSGRGWNSTIWNFHARLVVFLLKNGCLLFLNTTWPKPKIQQCMHPSCKPSPGRSRALDLGFRADAAVRSISGKMRDLNYWLCAACSGVRTSYTDSVVWNSMCVYPGCNIVCITSYTPYKI